MVVDTIDLYLKLVKSTTLECLEYYYSGIIECFGNEFLRRPTVIDTQHLLIKAEEREFSGMLGSIDFMHWQWHNYPVGWQGQFTRGASNILQSSLKLLFLMTVGSDMLFFVTGSNNDINVLNQSPLFIDVKREHTLKVSFTVNGREHHMWYYLTDGIYPSWPVFIKGVPVPQQEKHQFFIMKQASVRKDVECAFGLLKKRFNIHVILRGSL
jgi:hypothetical protein